MCTIAHMNLLAPTQSLVVGVLFAVALDDAQAVRVALVVLHSNLVLCFVMLQCIKDKKGMGERRR